MSLHLSLGDGELLDWPDGRGDPPFLHNPPGRSALSYRIGRYDSWLELMIHALMDRDLYPLASTATEVTSSSTFMSRRLLLAPQRRRIRLNLAEEGNWILGLLHAWSAVGDVLTFYQERLVNEGYLRTARQPMSVHELVRLLDYRPEPAVAGSVELAFEATDVEGLPSRLEVLAGTAVASVPPPGQAPQTFETDGVLEARAEWNLLRPPHLDERAPPVLRGSDTELALRGTSLALDPGDGLLIRGRRGGEEVAFFRLVGGVEAVSADPAHTTVSWRQPLDADRPQAEITELEAYALRQQARLFGHQAPPWRDQPLATRRLYRSPLGGVQRLEPPAPWRALNEGLPEAAIRCLACDDAGHLFAGTAGDGLWSRAAGGGSWRQGEGGFAQLDVLSLAVEPTGGVLAGTAGGSVYRSTDRGVRWTELTGRTLGRAQAIPSKRSRRLVRLPETPIRTLLATGGGQGWSLVVGTDNGVYLSTDLGGTWLPCNDGFPGSDGDETSLVIHALVSDGGRGLWAGTAAGVYYSRELGRRWRPCHRGLPGSDPLAGTQAGEVLALALHRDRRRGEELLLAGTSRGVYRSHDGGAIWHAARAGMREAGGLGSPAIHSLAVVEDAVKVSTHLFAGSPAGLWTSQDLGDSWQRVELEAQGVDALAAGPRGQLVAASPLAGFGIEQWPDFRLSGGRIDLDRLASAPADGSWLVLAPDTELEEPPPAVYRVESTSSVDRNDFTLEATVTRLHVETDARLRRFPLRRTRAFFDSEELAVLPRPRAVDPARAMAGLRQLLGAMETSRALLVSAEAAARPAESSTAETPASSLAGEQAAGQAPPGQEAVDAAEPADAGAPDGGAPDGAAPEGEALDDGASEDSAAAAAEQRGEGDEYGRRMIAGELESALAEATRSSRLELPEDPWRSTSGVLAEARRIALDPLSLSVRANVVTAGEGETVHDEVLGNGDASQVFQRFSLSEPLAYRRGAPAPRATLSLQVNDQLWQEVPRLYGEAPDARVYEIELDHEGRATVVFGDGVHGARLPTGRGNVVATYRTGTTDRDILPGSVRLMSSRPLGLAQVVNPLAGTAGAAAESLDSIRERAPLSLRTLGRIISLGDYQDFATTFPGIAKAAARELVLDGREIVHLTVATRGQHHRPAADSRLLETLLEAIEEICGDPRAVHIAPFRRVGLEVIAKVRPARTFTWEELAPRLRSAMEQRFSFERSRFGEALSLAEAIRVLHGVRGVESVDVDVFRRTGSATELARRVMAGRASWDSGAQTVMAAELVWLERLELAVMD